MVGPAALPEVEVSLSLVEKSHHYGVLGGPHMVGITIIDVCETWDVPEQESSLPLDLSVFDLLVENAENAVNSVISILVMLVASK